jgi:hypothetical protein
MAKAEKNAREAIEPRKARETNVAAKKPSRQVVGVLALPPPLLSPTTNYSDRIIKEHTIWLKDQIMV